MRNFPHQFARIRRFSEALGVYDKAVLDGVRVDDDEQLGLVFARNNVYQFRGHPADIERRIAEERRKPKANRGMETAAREMRRTFSLLGLIGGDGRLTELGSAIRNEEGVAGVTSRSKLFWHFAFWNLTLDQPNYHPYQMLLRLARERGPLRKYQMTLCLEAADDSEAEFSRVAGLLSLPEGQLRDRCGASEAAFENNQKVLPAIAVDLGDLAKSGDDEYVFHPRDMVPVPAIVPAAARSARRERPRAIATRQIEGSGRATYEVDTDMSADRRNRHEALVDQLKIRFEAFQPNEIPGAYDLVISAGNRRIMFEVKTIEGDQYRQVLAAVGQLFFYKFEHSAGGRETSLMIAVDRPVDPRLQDFVTTLDIGLIVFFGTEVHYMTNTAKQILEPLS